MQPSLELFGIPHPRRLISLDNDTLCPSTPELTGLGKKGKINRTQTQTHVHTNTQLEENSTF